MSLKNIVHRPLEVENSQEIIAAVVVILFFSAFLLANFLSGFNIWLYFLAALVGFVLCLLWPRAGLFSLVFLTLLWAKFFTLQPLIFNNIEYKFYLVDIIFCATALGTWLRLAKGEWRIKWRSPDLWLIGWLLLTTLYFGLSLAVWDGDFALAVSSFKNYAFYPLLYFVVFLLMDSWREQKRLAAFVLAGAVGIIGFIIFGLITGQGLWTEITPLSTAGARILDFDHAFYLVLIVCWLLVHSILKEDKLSRAAKFLLPVFVVGIIGSLMRHLWLAALVGILSLGWFLTKAELRRWRRLAGQYTVALLVAGALAVFFIATLPFANFSQTLSQKTYEVAGRAASLANSQDTSIAWRGAVWQSVWQEYKNKLWLGLGFGQKVFIDMGDYRDYIEVRNIHNSFLAIFAQMGLIGFGWWLMFYGSLWRSLRRTRGIALNVRSGLLSVRLIMVFCAVAFLFQPYLEANFFNLPFWLVLGLGRRFYESTLSQQI